MTEVSARDVSSLPVRPKPSPVGPVDRRRVLLATGAIVAVVCGIEWAVRALPDSGIARTVLAVALGVAVVPVIASPAEWFVHRFVYHEAVIRPLSVIFTVHTAHHYAYFPPWRYVTGGPPRRLSIKKRTPDAQVAPVRNAAVRLAHFTWYMGLGAVVIWLPAWFLTGDVAFLVGAVVGTAVVSNLFVVVTTPSIGRAATGSSRPSRGSRSSTAITTSTTWRWEPTSTSCCRWPIWPSAHCVPR